MGCGIKLTVDYAFKRTFGTEENRNVLRHLLNSLLQTSLKAPITEIAVLNPTTDKTRADDKLTIFDIKARDADGREFIIEVQLYPHKNFAERLVYYGAKEYSSQLVEGESYHQLKPVYVICITEATLFSGGSTPHSRFRLVDIDQRLTLTEQFEIHVVELPKFTRSVDQLLNDEERWTYFIQNSEAYDSDSLPQPLAIVPEICQAAEILTMVAHSPAEKAEYEDRLKAQRDEISRIAFALDEGLARGRLEGRLEGHLEGLAKGRAWIVRVGQLVMGPLSSQQRNQIESLTDLDVLDEIMTRIAPGQSWERVLEPLQSASPSSN